MRDEALQRAIDLIGGPAATAKLCMGSHGKTIKTQAVSQWEKCPANRVLTLENATDGQVTRYDLRPDIYGQQPETSAA